MLEKLRSICACRVGVKPKFSTKARPCSKDCDLLCVGLIAHIARTLQAYKEYKGDKGSLAHRHTGFHLAISSGRHPGGGPTGAAGGPRGRVLLWIARSARGSGLCWPVCPAIHNFPMVCKRNRQLSSPNHSSPRGSQVSLFV